MERVWVKLYPVPNSQPTSEQTYKSLLSLVCWSEEAFDTWHGGKKRYDYDRFFDKDTTHPDAKKGEKMV